MRRKRQFWLRKRGHCKMTSVQDHPFPGRRHWLQQQEAREAARVLGRHGGSRGSVGHGGYREVGGVGRWAGQRRVQE